MLTGVLVLFLKKYEKKIDIFFRVIIPNKT